mmetsp:Transcript_23084/g.69156  ORF Transcript_23084/g.69156 Transcript_23084/m.69156 type:complete len:294 (-) Transcript_23084:528-1409(-)
MSADACPPRSQGALAHPQGGDSAEDGVSRPGQFRGRHRRGVPWLSGGSQGEQGVQPGQQADRPVLPAERGAGAEEVASPQYRASVRGLRGRRTRRHQHRSREGAWQERGGRHHHGPVGPSTGVQGQTWPALRHLPRPALPALALAPHGPRRPEGLEHCCRGAAPQAWVLPSQALGLRPLAGAHPAREARWRHAAVDGTRGAARGAAYARGRDRRLLLRPAGLLRPHRPPPARGQDQAGDRLRGQDGPGAAAPLARRQAGGRRPPAVGGGLRGVRGQTPSQHGGGRRGLRARRA